MTRVGMMPEDVIVRDGADAALPRPPDVSMSVFMRQAVDFWREQDHSDRGLAFQHHYHMRNVENAVRVGKPPPVRPESLKEYVPVAVRHQRRCNMVELAVTRSERQHMGFGALRLMVEERFLPAELVLRAFQIANPAIFAIKDRSLRTLLGVVLEHRQGDILRGHTDLLPFTLARTPGPMLVVPDTSGNNILHQICRLADANLLAVVVRRLNELGNGTADGLFLAQNKAKRTPICETYEHHSMNSNNMLGTFALHLLDVAPADAFLRRFDKHGRLPIFSILYGNPLRREMMEKTLSLMEKNPECLDFEIPAPSEKRRRGDDAPHRSDVEPTHLGPAPFAPPRAPIRNSIFSAWAQSGCVHVVALHLRADEHPILLQKFIFDQSWRWNNSRDLVLLLTSGFSIIRAAFESLFQEVASVGLAGEFLFRERSLSGERVVDTFLFSSPASGDGGAVPAFSFLLRLCDSVNNAHKVLTGDNLLQQVLEHVLFDSHSVACGSDRDGGLAAATPFARWLRSDRFHWGILTHIFSTVQAVYTVEGAYAVMARSLIHVRDEYSRVALQGASLFTLTWGIGALVPMLMRDAPHPAFPRRPFSHTRNRCMTDLDVEVSTLIKLVEITSELYRQNPSAEAVRFTNGCLHRDFFARMIRCIKRWVTTTRPDAEAYGLSHRVREIEVWLEMVSTRYHGQHAFSPLEIKRHVDKLTRENAPWRVRESAEINLRKMLSMATAPESINFGQERATTARQSRAYALRAPHGTHNDSLQLYNFLRRVKARRHWRGVKAWALMRATAFYLHQTSQKRHWSPSGGREFLMAKADFESLELHI